MYYQGTIIQESLRDTGVLRKLKVVGTRVEAVTEKHQTPWLEQWTLHTVEVPESEAGQLADELSDALRPNYWYIDFKNEATHYIIFPKKVFKVNRQDPKGYDAATEYGVALNIPKHQLDFSPDIK